MSNEKERPKTLDWEIELNAEGHVKNPMLNKFLFQDESGKVEYGEVAKEAYHLAEMLFGKNCIEFGNYMNILKHIPENEF